MSATIPSHPAVQLPPDAAEAINSAPTAVVGGHAAVEAFFGYKPSVPTPVITQEQRALVNAEVKAHLPMWETFKNLAPGAYEQTRITVVSDTYQVRLLNGHVQDYNIVYTAPSADSSSSGFSLRWMTCSFMCTNVNYDMHTKRTDDRFASAIANLCAQGFAWN